MSSDGRIVIYAALGFFAGIFSFAKGLSSFHLKRLIENTPTSKVRAAAIGLVEVCGQAVPCGGKLSSPFSREDCIYYRYTIEEYRRSGKSSRWITVKTGDSRMRFYVKDDTGMILVNPDEASIDIPVDHEYQSGSGNDPPAKVLQFLSASGLNHEGFFGWNKTMRFREYFIAPGDSVYVMGTADMNRRREERNAENGADNLVIHKGVHNKTFYISDRQEKQVLSDLNGKVFWGVFGGAALSVICLGLILLYLRMI
jgi:hypothetical protein